MPARSLRDVRRPVARKAGGSPASSAGRAGAGKRTALSLRDICSAMRRMSVAAASIVGSSRPSLITLIRSEILKISAMRWLM